MKKKNLAIIMILSMMLAVTACGGKKAEDKEGETIDEVTNEDTRTYEEAKVITADEVLSVYDFDISECVSVGDYKSIKVEPDGNYEITEAEVTDYINSYLSNNTTYTVTEKTNVETGDIVNIDYSGTIDGVQFDGGTASGQHLEIGSSSFIDGFEDGLLGHNVGDDVTLELTFPDDYWNEEYAGKEVTFAVKINSIDESQSYTYETVTDEYVSDTYGYSTKQEWYDSIYQTLVSNMDQQRLSDAQVLYFEQLMAMSEVTVPEELVESELDETMRQMGIYAESTLGITLEEYLNQYEECETEEEYRALVHDEMVENLKEQLVIDYILKQEELTITEGGYKEFLAYYLDAYGMEEDAFYERYGNKETIMLIYAENMTITSLIENAVSN